MSAVDACAVILLAGVVLYALLGGADFGAGFWDLTAGGDRRGEAPARAHRPRHRAGLGGQPRLAHLRAGGHVDRVPRGLQLDPVHPVHPLHARGARHRPARGRLRLPKGLDPAGGAPRLRGDLRHRLGAHALLPRRHPRRDRLGARAQGQRRRRHLDQLGQPLGGDGRGAGGRDLRLPGGRVPDRRRAAHGRRRARALLHAARAGGRGGDGRPRARRHPRAARPTRPAPTTA